MIQALHQFLAPLYDKHNWCKQKKLHVHGFNIFLSKNVGRAQHVLVLAIIDILWTAHVLVMFNDL